ncbi:hypothetical protein E2R51_19160 [Jeotgalibacillus sp. S-D1]|uniref:DUF4097 family beta strand repeat-containing protein n=1 Tax=Jeotgalibacillus sp. S-D1 TaxID=2552189 RepID=UPI0010598ACA|nr:DUF4097 family beta strand repeat-containing protein [Jeotgalibacillus sp. S-D1]TDL30316.1 hypothetical protein E2R51_19160 [Jeotgalibacillus sp. S-D1]
MIKNSLAILLIAAALILMYINYNGSFPWIFSNESQHEAEVTDNIESIELDIASVETELVPVDSNSIRVEGTKKTEIKLDASRDKIKIEAGKKGLGFFSFGSDEVVTIYLPEKYAGSMAIKIGSGDLNTTSFSEKNPLTLTALSLNIGSGESIMGHIDTEEFSFNGSSGEVTIESLVTKMGDVDLSSGDIDLASYKGPLKANVSSGEFNAVFDELNDDIEVKVSSGDVNLDLPDNADFELKGNASSGSVSTSFDLKNQQLTDKSISGTYGKGTHKIVLKASSGDIEVD